MHFEAQICIEVSNDVPRGTQAHDGAVVALII